ncbi:MAG: exodeoxyribonuclease VII small subunit [Actinomycetia bacterium]|nr:exodeoxyribonuclease VII small subunit [Actinomycetes bacterium]
MKMNEENLEKRDFDEVLKELEEIVSTLERGNLSLEESLKKFERGIKLSTHCLKKLNEAEKKIETLIEKAGRESIVIPYQEEEKKGE